MKSCKKILYGTLSGCVGYMSTIPLEFIKQYLQTTKNSISVLQIIRKKGFMYTFRGGLFGVCVTAPQMAIRFGSFDYLQRNTKNSIWTNGFTAGFLDGTILAPVSRIQTIQQMNSHVTYRKSFETFLQNVRMGHQIIYPIAFRNAFHTACLFGFTDMIKQKVYTKDYYGFIDNFVVASIANIPAVVLCSGFDIIRAKQIKHVLQNKEFTVSDIVRTIVKKQGIRGFYTGLTSLYLYFGIRFSLSYALYEHLLSL